MPLAVAVAASADVKRVKTQLETAGAYDSSRRIVRTGDGNTAVSASGAGHPRFLVPVVPCAADAARDVARAFASCKLVSDGLDDGFQNTAIACAPADDDTAIPTRFERYDNLVILPVSARVPPAEDTAATAAYAARVCTALGVSRLLFKQVQDPADELRAPKVRVLCGFGDESSDSFRGKASNDNDNHWTSTTQNSVVYVWNPLRTMFSPGNISEKIRQGNWDLSGEHVLDLYAGIGYWALPYVVRGGAASVIACEMNPASIEGLKRGCARNRVRAVVCADMQEARALVHDGALHITATPASDGNEVPRPQICIVPGDNRAHDYRDLDVDRVSLGLLPHARDGLVPACTALSGTRGGWLHVHENSAVHNVAQTCDEIVQTIRHTLAHAHPRPCAAAWDVQVRHIERVKSFGPRVFHWVFDIECRPRVEM